MTLRSTTAQDLSAFTSLKLDDDSAYERARLIRERFPSVEHMDWKIAFDRDVGLFGRVIRDILKLDQSVPGRPGPRPEPNFDRSLILLRQLMADDYCLAPFTEVFRILGDKRSNTQLSRKIGLSVSQTRRLRVGMIQPSLGEVVAIADAFGKHPSFFLEYRIAYISGAIAARLEAAPEASVKLYRSLSRT